MGRKNKLRQAIVTAEDHRPSARCDRRVPRPVRGPKLSGEQLRELGEEYLRETRLYRRDAVLPGKVLRVQYEEVVADLETRVRRILAFCDLEFEPACLEFHRNERVIRTASSEQVRQPLFASGLDHWRHFEPWLGPLKEALGPDLVGPPPRNPPATQGQGMDLPA